MFRKAVDARGQQRLSGADRKKLRRAIRERWKHAAEVDLDVILPPKADVMVTKLANRGLVYALEGSQPLLFDSDGRGADLYPTVYALWKCPNLVPSFLLKGAEVSQFVLSGADLMLPGVQIPGSGFSEFDVGEVWSVQVPFNSMPIAVGSTLIRSAGTQSEAAKGKLLKVIHFYGDWLWESAQGCFAPNEGFHRDMVQADPGYTATQDSSQAQLDDGQGSDQDSSLGQGQRVQSGEAASVEHEGAVDAGAGLEGTPTVGQQDTSVVAAMAAVSFVGTEASRAGAAAGAGGRDGRGSAASERAADSDLEAGGAGSGEQAAAPLGTPEDALLSPVQMDALLDQCLLQALCVSVKPTDLPLPASTLWSHHILLSRPPGTVLDVKKSSHKKLSKWLQTKVASRLMTGKEDKHRKEFILSGVNFKHPDLLSFEPMRSSTTANATSSAAPGGDLALANDGAANGPVGSGCVEVEEVWKSSTHVGPILAALGADKDRLYSAVEACQLALDYVQKEQLVKPSSPSIVVLDAALCDALFKGAVKKGSAYPTETHMRDLGPLFLARMQAYHRVTRGAKTAVRKGPLQSIEMVCERRQGNKKVTRVTGLEAFLIQPEPLAADLQKRFACSTSVGEVPGKKGQSEVVVQGGVLEDLGGLLVEQYCVPKKHIQVLDKTRR